jgi:hypothetical protein
MVSFSDQFQTVSNFVAQNLFTSMASQLMSPIVNAAPILSNSLQQYHQVISFYQKDKAREY